MLVLDYQVKGIATLILSTFIVTKLSIIEDSY